MNDVQYRRRLAGIYVRHIKSLTKLADDDLASHRRTRTPVQQSTWDILRALHEMHKTLFPGTPEKNLPEFRGVR